MPSLAMVWDLIARDGASGTFLRVGAAADKAAVSTTKASGGVAAAGASAEKNAKRMAGFAAAIGAIVAVDLGKHMVDMAGEFQQSTNILVTAAGETTKNLAMVRQGILDIASSTGTKWQNVVEGVYNLEKAGYRGADALKVMKAAAQGAREEGADLGIVTQAMTSIMASYHLGADQSVTVMNQLKTAAGEAKTSMQLFSGSLSTVLPLASANGISFADISGSLASLTQHGTSADQAAQELAFTMRGLAAPNMVAQKAMAQLGISSVDVAQKLGDGPGGRGLAGTLSYLSETVLSKMGPSGQVLLNTFNQSKVAAKDAQILFEALPPAAQKLAQGYKDGSMSLGQFRIAMSGLQPAQASLLRQWVVTQNGAKGFQQALKNGVSGSKTYSDMIKAMTGGANGLNTTLQLTGESMDGTNERIKRVAEAARGAGKDVAGWDITQKNMKVQMDIFKQSIEAAGIRIGTALIPAVTEVVHVLSSMFSFLVRNGKTVGLVAATLGGLAAAVMVAVVATKLWAAATALLNAVMDANPIVLIGIAIAALIAGLIYAYTHFEGFRKVADAVFHAVADAAQWMWNTVLKPTINALVTAWQWLWSNVIKPLWDNVGRPLFSAIATTFTWLWNHVGPALKGMKLAWDALWAGVKAAWNFAEPIFATIGKIVYAIIGGVVLLAIKAVKLAWETLWLYVDWAWTTVGKPTFDTIAAIAGWLWDKVLKPIFGAVHDGWTLLWAGIKLAWDNVGKPVFDLIGNSLAFVWNKVIKPIFDSISSSWDALWGGMSDAFTSIWGGVKSAIVTGVNGIIDLINGFIGAINKVLGALPGGLSIGTLGHIGEGAASEAGSVKGAAPAGSKSARNTQHYAMGGVLPGYTPGRDVHQFWSATAGTLNLSGGEGILVPEAVTGLGGAGAIHTINAAFAGGRVPGRGSSFAGGGVWEAMFNTVKAKFPDANLNSGYRPGANDFHGQGKAVDIGRQGQSGGNGTPFLASVSQWITDAFGGKSLEIIYDGLGDNRADVKNGRTYNYGEATSAQHHNHVHWAVDSTDVLKGGGSGGGGWLSGISNAVTSAVGSVTTAMLDTAERPLKAGIAALPAGVLRSFASGGLGKIDGVVRKMITAGNSDGRTGPTATAGVIGDHLALIKQALKLAGVTDDLTNESAVDTIVRYESSWNPNAINLTDSNARAGHPSQGLMQTIPDTFNAWRLAQLSPSITDPLSNLVAGIRYAVARYGDLVSVPGVRAVNNGGSYVGYDAGGMLMPGVTPAINLTGKPEAVLTNSQWGKLDRLLDEQQSGSGGGVFHLYDTNGVLLGTMAGVADQRIGTSQHRNRVATAAGTNQAVS